MFSPLSVSLVYAALSITLTSKIGASPDTLPFLPRATENIGNVAVSLFPGCLLHIVEQSGKVDLDFGVPQGPLVLHRFHKYKKIPGYAFYNDLHEQAVTVPKAERHSAELQLSHNNGFYIRHKLRERL